MFLNDKVVGIAVELFEGEDGGVTKNNLVNCVREAVPDVFGSGTVHLPPCSEWLWVVHVIQKNVSRSDTLNNQ